MGEESNKKLDGIRKMDGNGKMEKMGKEIRKVIVVWKELEVEKRGEENAF